MRMEASLMLCPFPGRCGEGPLSGLVGQCEQGEYGGVSGEIEVSRVGAY